MSNPDPTPSEKAMSVATTTLPPDLTEVEELLTTMKQTLGALGHTFDTLGEQTARIAKLGPAMDTAHQVSSAHSS